MAGYLFLPLFFSVPVHFIISLFFSIILFFLFSFPSLERFISLSFVRPASWLRSERLKPRILPAVTTLAAISG
jgi:hypothetical protein